MGYSSIAAKQGRLLGTVRPVSAGNARDSSINRLVWNLYNQRPRWMLVTEGTNTWTYTTDTWRQANASAANQIEYVCGLAAELDVLVNCTVALLNNSANAAKLGIGVDSTTTPTGLRAAGYVTTVVSYQPMTADYVGVPGLGYHYLAWMERGADGGDCIFIGDDGGSGIQGGMKGWILG